MLREVLALSLCHSKSAVPAHLLDDPAALRALMLRGAFTDLDRQTAEPRDAPADGDVRRRSLPRRSWRATAMSPARPSRGSSTLVQRPVSSSPMSIDAIRVLRAADALRQRGTTQRTSAGYEICVDRRSGLAVMALRSVETVASARSSGWTSTTASPKATSASSS